MLSYNVAGLLRVGTRHERRYPVDDVRIDIAEDLTLAAPIDGEVRLSRTGRSILARAHLTHRDRGHCSRCLTAVVAPIEVEIEEEALPSIDIDTGHAGRSRPTSPTPCASTTTTSSTWPNRCARRSRWPSPSRRCVVPTVAGLCLDCGVDLNAVTDHAHAEDAIDPRLAALAELARHGTSRH